MFKLLKLFTLIRLNGLRKNKENNFKRLRDKQEFNPSKEMKNMNLNTFCLTLLIRQRKILWKEDNETRASKRVGNCCLCISRKLSKLSIHLKNWTKQKPIKVQESFTLSSIQILQPKTKKFFSKCLFPTQLLWSFSMKQYLERKKIKCQKSWTLLTR